MDCNTVQAANVLINHDGRVVLSDFGVTANLERATPSTLRANSHAEASTSDAAGANSAQTSHALPCSPAVVTSQARLPVLVHAGG